MPDLNETLTAHLNSLRDNTGEVELFPRADWRYEVDNGDTSHGYDGWLETKIEFEVSDIEQAIADIMHRAPRAFMTDGDEIAFNEAVINDFGILRMMDTEAPERAAQFLQKDIGVLIYGNTCGVLPTGLAEDVSRLAHLGMVAYEARSTTEAIDGLILEMAEKYGILNDAVGFARTRQGLEDGPAP